MKKFNINISLLIFMLSCFTYSGIIAQELNSNEIGNTAIEIPSELKSELTGLENASYNFIIHSKFSKKNNGFVNVYFDQNDKIYKIIGPKSINKNVLTQRYRYSVPCPQCLPEYELSCILVCIWNAVFGTDD